MVYCSKCGTKNEDTAKMCSNCGAPLYTVGESYRGSDREHYRRVQNECFGLPNGGMIAGVVLGALIIIWGLSIFLESTYNITINLWPIILIIFGVLMVAGTLYRWSRRK
jgi:uncharacterized membrane protein YvbJ